MAEIRDFQAIGREEREPLFISGLKTQLPQSWEYLCHVHTSSNHGRFIEIKLRRYHRSWAKDHTIEIQYEQSDNAAVKFIEDVLSRIQYIDNHDYTDDYTNYHQLEEIEIDDIIVDPIKAIKKVKKVKCENKILLLV